ncbi:MAG: 16S rRNA (uracil(1498)-N(3))-methyltransferase [Thermotogae bacterium]|nr:16S rRNA (uracil(1498)-N(3))-methyltransferase [Thermotogota bacterium]
MDRFFAHIEDGIAEIRGEEFHHLYRVLRHKIGDRVRVFTGRREFIAEIVEIATKDKRATLKIIEELPPLLPPVEVVVAVSPPKGQRFDALLEKLVEVGVSGIVPMICERTVRRPAEKKDRWGRIVLSAVKQSGRTDIPTVYPPMKLEQVLRVFDSYEGKFAGLIGSRTPIVAINPRTRNIILIGPEGDFSPNEKEKIKKANFKGISLGRIILRVETAAIVSASCLLQRAWFSALSS